jgi:hypothetical protein
VSRSRSEVASWTTVEDCDDGTPRGETTVHDTLQMVQITFDTEKHATFGTMYGGIDPVSFCTRRRFDDHDCNGMSREKSRKKGEWALNRPHYARPLSHGTTGRAVKPGITH